MTQPVPIRRDHRAEHLRTALSLAARGIPVLPLRAGKRPFGNCAACAGNVRGPPAHEERRHLPVPCPLPRLGRCHH